MYFILFHYFNDHLIQINTLECSLEKKQIVCPNIILLIL